LLDDDRLYRQTEAPLPPTPVKAKAKPKSKAKAKPRRSRGTRSSKRVKLSNPEDEEEEDDDVDEVDDTVAEIKQDVEEDNDYGGMTWECIAVNMEEYTAFLETISKSRDPNEKALRKAVMDTVMPILEKKAEAQRQKALRKQREWENMQKLATAKRSSRIAGRMEKQKEEEEAAAAEQKRLADLAMAHKEQERQSKLEADRESRMMTREQRLKEREMKRILHEEELARLAEMEAKGEDPDGRHSERQLKTQMEKRQKELEELKEEEDEWIFDCSVCGMHGENFDDGTHSIACEKCNIWQHSKCHGIKEEDAESDDFHFVCADCKRKEEDAMKPRIRPLKLGRVAGSPSPAPERMSAQPGENGTSHPGESTPKGRIVTGVSIFNRPESITRSPHGHRIDLENGPSLSPHGQSPGPPGYQPTVPHPIGVPQQAWNGVALPPPQRPIHRASDSPPLLAPTHSAPRQGSPGYHLHQQAHASAVASASIPHQPPGQHANGHANGHMLPPSSPHHHPRPSSSQAGGSVQRPGSSHSMNGSPTKSRQQQSSPLQAMRNSPHHGQVYTAANPFGIPSSPNTSFPPPQYQGMTGQSPVKQPSPTPPAQTPSSNHAAPPTTTPMANILRATPQAMSSPIPPIGNGPVIPTKHDTPRTTVPQDGIGGTPVFPPAMALSPSATQTQGGRGMGTESGDGGLGTASIPVKKLPEQQPQPLAMEEQAPKPTQSLDAVMRDV